MTEGYTTLGSLPTFSNIGGVYTVSSWTFACTKSEEAMNT